MKKGLSIFLIAIMLFAYIPKQSHANPLLIAGARPLIGAVMIAAGASFSSTSNAEYAISNYLSTAPDLIIEGINRDFTAGVQGVYAISNDVYDSIRAWVSSKVLLEGINNLNAGSSSIPLSDLTLDIPISATKLNLQNAVFGLTIFPGISAYIKNDDGSGGTKCYVSGSNVYSAKMEFTYLSGILNVRLVAFDSSGNFAKTSSWQSISALGYGTLVSVLTSSTIYQVIGQPGVADPDIYDPALDGPGDYFWFTDDGEIIFSPIPPPPAPKPEKPKKIIGFPLPQYDPANPSLPNPKTDIEIGDLPGADRPDIFIGDGELIDHNPLPFEEPTTNPFTPPTPEDLTSPTQETTTTNPDGSQTTTGTTGLPTLITDILTDSHVDPVTGERVPEELNFEPLKQAGAAFTWKFPFSLPWDLLRCIESLKGPDTPPVIPINVDTGLIKIQSNVELGAMWNSAAIVARSFELVCFCVGLIFATRRIMGGDV